MPRVGLQCVIFSNHTHLLFHSVTIQKLIYIFVVLINISSFPCCREYTSPKKVANITLINDISEELSMVLDRLYMLLFIKEMCLTLLRPLKCP